MRAQAGGTPLSAHLVRYTVYKTKGGERHAEKRELIVRTGSFSAYQDCVVLLVPSNVVITNPDASASVAAVIIVKTILVVLECS